MPHVNRVVIGVNDEKKSAVIYRDSSNHQEVPESLAIHTLGHDGTSGEQSGSGRSWSGPHHP